MVLRLLYCAAILFVFINYVECHEIIVNGPLGSIRGVTLKSRSGRDYYAFRSIRYAEPPIGILRWKPPVPIKTSWNNIYDATVDGPVCYQQINEFPEELMSEDCLRLNVYTRKVDRNATLPVLVFIHGGGFYSGSGNSYAYNPIYLMDHDIVVVTFNYRLGVMGFLSTGTIDMPGNDGFKDQVLVMKWIQDNILYYGGDPKRVTLTGHSVGAMSTIAHVASPMSQGLFHQVIAMSGSAVAQWDLPTHQFDLFYKLANKHNCLDNTVSEILACLHQIPANKLTKTVDHFFKIGIYPLLIFKPVIEPDFGQKRFLIESPEQAFLSNKFANVSLLTGIVSNEVSWATVIGLADDYVRNEIISNFETVAADLFLYEHGTDRSKNISAMLKDEYLSDPLTFDEHIENTQYLIYNTTITLPDLTFEINQSHFQLFSDGVIAYGVHRLVQLLWDKVKVYYYNTSFRGRFSIFQNIGFEWEGVDHEDDLQYIFNVQRIGPLIEVTDPENIAVERITRLWTNFVKYG